MTILMAKQVSQKFMALTKIYHVINPIIYIYIYVLHPPKNGDSDLSLFTYTDLGGCTNIKI